MPPLYDFECKKCGATASAVRRVDDRNQPPGTDPEDSEKLDSQPPADSGVVSCGNKPADHDWEKLLNAARVVIPHHHQAVNN